MASSARLSSANYLFLFLPPFFWSTNFIIGKALVGYVPPWTLNAGRFSVAAIILLPVLLHSDHWRSVPRQYIPTLILMSLSGVTAFNSVLYMGLSHTTAINATLVNSTTPATTACLTFGPGRAALVYNTLPLYATVLSVLLLGERLMPYQLIGGLGIVAGVMIGASEGAVRSGKNL